MDDDYSDYDEDDEYRTCSDCGNDYHIDSMKFCEACEEYFCEYCCEENHKDMEEDD